MKKRKIKQFLKKVRGIQTWKMFLVLILLLFVAATCLRIDHLRMMEIKEAVLAADEEGDDEKIAEKLKELRDFAATHIVVNIVEENGNQKITFGTGVFYLENQYLRAANAALEKAERESSDSNPNGNVYAAATAVCKPIAIANGWEWNSEGYLNCMTSEIAKYPTTDSLEVKADIPSTELYRHEFVSPVWTFSVSGIMILIILVLIVVIFTRVVIWATLRIMMILLKNH